MLILNMKTIISWVVASSYMFKLYNSSYQFSQPVICILLWAYQHPIELSNFCFAVLINSGGLGAFVVQIEMAEGAVTVSGKMV
jgi:hypothetical protein